MRFGNCAHPLPRRAADEAAAGLARRLVIVTLELTDSNDAESVRTLGCAERAKQIKDKAKVNMEPKDANRCS
jgi:hypothetical protein